MKKLTLLFFVLISMALPHFLPAQAELGISGGAILMIPKYPPYSNDPYSLDQVHHIRHIQPGFRLEGNYLLHDFSFPVTSFNAVGVSYYPAAKDSSYFSAYLNNFGPVRVKGFEKSSLSVIGLRVGYEIPQEFNDFLTLYAGWGFSFMSQKARYILPDPDQHFTYTQSDFDPSTFELRKTRSLGIEILGGAAYEFEHFFLLGQYSLIYALDGNDNSLVRFRHGLSVSVFVPLKRF